MENKSELLAIIRVRGVHKLHPKRSQTLEMLNLYKPNQATLVHSNPSYLGMLDEAKDYITWGPISDKVLLSLLQKRAEVGSKKLSALKSKEEIEAVSKQVVGGQSLKDAGIKRTLRLTPPSKGWKDKKKRFPQGDLGPRPSIDALIKRMI